MNKSNAMGTHPIHSKENKAAQKAAVAFKKVKLFRYLIEIPKEKHLAPAAREMSCATEMSHEQIMAFAQVYGRSKGFSLDHIMHKVKLTPKPRKWAAINKK
jgi:hypothetical protein